MDCINFIINPVKHLTWLIFVDIPIFDHSNQSNKCNAVNTWRLSLKHIKSFSEGNNFPNKLGVLEFNGIIMHNIQARKIPRFYPRVCQTLKLHDYHEILAVSLTFHGNNKNCKIILLPFFVYVFS